MFLKMVSVHDDCILLDNGVLMPLIGYGTTHSGGYNSDAVVYALRDCGYRMVDTAKRYGTESFVGLDIKASGVDRSQIFLISKLWPTDMGFHAARDSFHASCKRLGVDYLDCYMIHHPTVPPWLASPDDSQAVEDVRQETWRALETLYDEGYLRSLGVSNYEERQLTDLLDTCGIRPHAIQMEHHPFQQPRSLQRLCVENRVAFMGYCPLAKGTILKEDAIREIAQKLGVTPAQLCLRWSMQHGVPAVPKSNKREHVFENSQVYSFRIPEDDMRRMDELHDDRRVVRLDNVAERLTLPDGYKLT